MNGCSLEISFQVQARNRALTVPARFGQEIHQQRCCEKSNNTLEFLQNLGWETLACFLWSKVQGMLLLIVRDSIEKVKVFSAEGAKYLPALLESLSLQTTRFQQVASHRATHHPF